MEPLATRYPAHLIDRAMRRHRWVTKWREACDGHRMRGVTERDLAERIVEQARRVEGSGFKVSVRSLLRWHAESKRTGPDRRPMGAEGLVDRYRSPGKTERTPAAVDWFYSLYRTENKLSAKLCHEHTVADSHREGWHWPASYAATMAWLTKHDDVSLTYLCRQGYKRWAHKYLTHLTRSYDHLQPGDWFQADHSPLDAFCTYKGRKIRAHATAVLDLRSRCIVGLRIGPSPNQEQIIGTVHDAFKNWAVCEHLSVDCGRDFGARKLQGLSKREREQLRRALGDKNYAAAERRDADLVECEDPRWNGVLGELGVKTHFCIPYSPHSKGPTERWFRTMEGRGIAPRFASYTGNSPANKPECVDEAELPTLEQVREGVAEYLDEYHNTPHRGLGGATPLEVWRSAVRLRRVDNEALAFLMKSSPSRVTANGVRVRGILYRHPELTTGRFVGRDILVAVDPANLADAWAFELDTRKLLFPLRPEAPVAHGATDDDAREAIAESRRAQAMAKKVARASASRTRTMVERINESSRRKRAVMKATGTDDHRATEAAIVPVRTGFEGVSTPSRRAFDAAPIPDLDDEDFEALLPPEPTEAAVASDDDDDDWWLPEEAGKADAGDAGESLDIFDD
jgi:hypothetical protein